MHNFLNKKVLITQVKSGSNLVSKQKGSLVGLGLKGIGSSSALDCSSSVLGMIKSVAHLVKVSVA